jgi:hypothetical protein
VAERGAEGIPTNPVGLNSTQVPSNTTEFVRFAFEILEWQVLKKSSRRPVSYFPKSGSRRPPHDEVVDMHRSAIMRRVKHGTPATPFDHMLDQIVNFALLAVSALSSPHHQSENFVHHQGFR